MTASNWNFDHSHSTVNFHVRHMMIAKVHGRFSKWGGTLLLDNSDLTNSKLEVSIETASVDTRDEKRDGHLRSADFFDSERFPTMTYKSTSVTKISDDEYEVLGELTLRETTKPVKLTVEYNGTGKDPWGGTRAGFSAKATINRKDFGLHWNAALEAGGVLVSDEIKIAIEVEAVPATTEG
ncbi:MAG TPA: YceI family protein [Kofleriaceae bacterium]|nr:YceI family protein [Kofleriaceae bacterium]